LSRCRSDQRSVVPGQPREWARHFEQPRIVGVAPVPRAVVRPEQSLQHRFASWRVRTAFGRDIAPELDRQSRCRAVGNDTGLQRLAPKGLEISLVLMLSALLPEITQQCVRVGGEISQQDGKQLLRRMASVEGTYLRLHDRDRTVESTSVAPGFVIM